MSYPSSGYQPYSQPPPPGYGPYPGYTARQSTALGYVVAAAFPVLGALTVIPALVAADGFALVMFARLEIVRWVLAVIGGIITCYYLYAVIYIAANAPTEFVWLPLLALALWCAATVVTLLPATGAAMRRKQNQWG